MKKKLLSVLLTAAMSAALLAGCGTSSSATADASTSDVSEEAAASDSSDADGKVLNLAWSADMLTMDVHVTSSDYMIPMNVYDRLFDIKVNDDGSTEVVNSLVDTYTVSDDGLTYDFTLKSGIKFSNGEDLTASDVLYTFSRILTVEGSASPDFVLSIKGAQALYDGEATELEGLKVIDDLNFEITLEAPYAGFISELATAPCSIYDETSTEAAGSDFGVDPSVTVGTGPYKVESWTRNSEIVLVRNDNYWGEKPDVDKVIISIIPDASTRNMMYQNGEIDILDLGSLDSSIVQSTYYTTYADKIVSLDKVNVYYMTLNESMAPFDDVIVRKAIQMSIDRQSILDTVYGGQGSLIDGIFPTGLIGYNKDLQGSITYDPDAAKQLLADAGYPDGFEMDLELDSSTSNNTLMTYQIIQQNLADVGITANIQTYDESSWLDGRKSGDFGSFSAYWVADYNDPDNFIYTFFGDEAKTKARSLNYPDTDTMQAVMDARSIIDESKRIAKYQELEKKIVIDDAAWVPLFSTKQEFAISDNVKSFTPYWSGYSDFYVKDVVMN